MKEKIKEPKAKRVLFWPGPDSGEPRPNNPHPWDPPEIGDELAFTGYIKFLRLDEYNFSPPINVVSPNMLANRQVELWTYCHLALNSKQDYSGQDTEFRILYDYKLKGQRLAVSVALIAALKDAFMNKVKLEITGELSKVVLTIPLAASSDEYWELKSIRLLQA